MIKRRKYGYHEYYRAFEGASGTVSNLLLDFRRVLWDYVELTMGCLGEEPKAGKGNSQAGLGRKKHGKIKRGMNGKGCSHVNRLTVSTLV